MSEYRIEKDSLGEVKVLKSKYWGAQTQRSLENFKIGKYKMPIEVIHSFGLLKRCCAEVNVKNGDVKKEIGDVIVKVTKDVENGKYDEHFPLVIFQTGSGTQTNMNLNEVVSNIGNEILGKKMIHPNDHVNKGQSSNDTFPTVMKMCATKMIVDKLLPALKTLKNCFVKKEKEFEGIIKIGRTHTMDATPISLSQEFSAFRTQMELSIKRVEKVLPNLYQLPIGGTAVGTGLNSREDFGPDVCELIKKYSSINFESLPNKFEGLSSNDTMAELSGALNTVGCSLMKISNDIRFLSSGPRCGIGEILLPTNEPGSSIMPGKINPTQCEAITMVCCQVFGNHTTVTFGCSNGHFQLNVFKPVIIANILQSIELISDACINFTKKCVDGIKPNLEKIKENLKNSLMLVTALNPIIGYDKAAIVAKKAYKENMTLKKAAKELGFLEEDKFDEYVDPKKMIVPKPSTKK